jgi:hypothetical protein
MMAERVRRVIRLALVVRVFISALLLGVRL